jgi:hypothetical protein
LIDRVAGVPGLAATGEAAKAGPLALAVVLVLAIACYFLFRSMTRHLRKVRTQFPANPPPGPPDAVEPPGPRGLGPDTEEAATSAPATDPSPAEPVTPRPPDTAAPA